MRPSPMSDFIPKPSTTKIGGLGPRAQKLQALREKAAQQKPGANASSAASTDAPKAKDTFRNTRKPSFQRKAT